MHSQGVPVSGTTSIALADELGQSLPCFDNGGKRLAASRVFVDKVVDAAHSMEAARCDKAREMVRLAYHIEATQENLESLNENGLGLTEASNKLLDAIVDMGQKFLSCHKELCQEISKRALSQDR